MSHELSFLWFWGCAQATCLAVAVWGAAVLARRLPAAARAMGLVTALLLVAALPWCSLMLPWQETAARVPRPSALVRSAPAAAAGPATRPAAVTALAATASDATTRLSRTATSWLARVFDPDVAAPAVRRLTPAVSIAGGLLVLWASIRWLVGLWQVAVLARQARPCADQRLRLLADPLARELGVTGPVDYRSSARLTTPAVIGWRRPTVILPPDWDSWPTEILRAALAHELAHARRRDPLTTTLAQLFLALTYFNPVAHVLARRLRLEQEIAADALAAGLTNLGGGRSYAAALAALALGRRPQPLLGPALAFLSARSGLVARLEMLRDTRPKRGRWHRTLAAAVPLAVGLTGLAIAACRPTVDEASETRVAQESLGQIGKAFDFWTSVHNDELPAAAICDRDGKPLLSWRVSLLPWLDEGELYEQFRRDEPWDSEHNLKLLARMPDVFKSPGQHDAQPGLEELRLRGRLRHQRRVEAKRPPLQHLQGAEATDGLAEEVAHTVKSGMTRFLIPTGPGTVSEKLGKPRATIRDGRSNTILLVEAEPQQAVPWTKPDDLPVDLENPLKGLRDARDAGFLAVMADGSVRQISGTVTAERLRALFTPSSRDDPYELP